jgi:hypothetical protein
MRRSTCCSTPNSSAVPAPRAGQHRLELVEPVVPERAQLGPGEQAAVQDRGVVARIGDHRVARGEDRAQRAHVRLMAGGEDERLLRAHPLRDLALELQVQARGAVEQPRARQARAVLLQRLARAGDHPRVVREPEVVVGAEHDPLGALHLDDRAGG